MSNPTDTPETNEAQRAWLSWLNSESVSNSPPSGWDFARSLELRCTELEQELENYRPVAEAKGATKAISQRDAALAQIAALSARVAELEGTLDFIRDECHWEVGDSDQPFGGGDERIGPAIDDVFARVGKLVSRIQQEAQDPKDLVKQIDSLRAQLTKAQKDGQRLLAELNTAHNALDLAGQRFDAMDEPGFRDDCMHAILPPSAPLPSPKEGK